MFDKKILLQKADTQLQRWFGLKPGWHRELDLVKNNLRLAREYAGSGNRKEALFRLKLIEWFDRGNQEAQALRKSIEAGIKAAAAPLDIAEESDAKLLAEVHKAAFPVYWKEAEISNMLMASGTRAWLARRGGKPAAMLMMRAQFEQAEILTLATTPEVRRAGLAARLLAAGEAAMRDAGVKKIFLEVAQNNEAAVALYKRQGYTETSRRKGYYKQADNNFVDALVMSKELGA